MKEQAQLDCNNIGIDWNTEPSIARDIIGDTKTLQGNLDPCALYAPDEVLINKTKEMLTCFGQSKHIVNLGHGVYLDTDPEKVKLFINTVKEHRH